MLPAACAKPVFYHGPKSDHYNGRHFFNPDGFQGTGGAQHETYWQYLLDTINKRHSWPKSVPVAPTVPPRRVDGSRMLVTWIGHSTVLIQTQGLNILTDPVWSERPSPVSFAGVHRVREPGVRLDDLPRIDLILVSHDHFDHMDRKALSKLWERDRPLIVTGLGNDVRMSDWGITSVARDWGQEVPVRPGISVRVDRAHHWSARTEDDKNLTLWCGFTVHLPGGDLYYAGDTGAGRMQWPQEATQGRPVRLAILPIGALHVNGVVTGNHIGPPEAVQAFQQIHAAYALGVHWGTFELTDEPIDLPPTLLRQTLAQRHIPADRFRVTEAGQPWDVPGMVASAGASAVPSPHP
jgi:L-ascorbate metabolism protein UlaG (beta-lactamase superfamily)